MSTMNKLWLVTTNAQSISALKKYLEDTNNWDKQRRLLRQQHITANHDYLADNEDLYQRSTQYSSSYTNNASNACNAKSSAGYNPYNNDLQGIACDYMPAPSNNSNSVSSAAATIMKARQSVKRPKKTCSKIVSVGCAPSDCNLLPDRFCLPVLRDDPSLLAKWSDCVFSRDVNESSTYYDITNNSANASNATTANTANTTNATNASASYSSSSRATASNPSTAAPPPASFKCPQDCFTYLMMESKHFKPGMRSYGYDDDYGVGFDAYMRTEDYLQLNPKHGYELYKNLLILPASMHHTIQHCNLNQRQNQAYLDILCESFKVKNVAIKSAIQNVDKRLPALKMLRESGRCVCWNACCSDLKVRASTKSDDNDYVYDDYGDCDIQTFCQYGGPIPWHRSNYYSFEKQSATQTTEVQISKNAIRMNKELDSKINMKVNCRSKDCSKCTGSHTNGFQVDEELLNPKPKTFTSYGYSMEATVNRYSNKPSSDITSNVHGNNSQNPSVVEKYSKGLADYSCEQLTRHSYCLWTETKQHGITMKWKPHHSMFCAGNITEKARIAKWSCLVKGKCVLDLYAGIGYFSVPLMVYCGAQRLIACDLNGHSLQALQVNLHTACRQLLKQQMKQQKEASKRVNKSDTAVVSMGGSVGSLMIDVCHGDNADFEDIYAGQCTLVSLGMLKSSVPGLPLAVAALDLKEKQCVLLVHEVIDEQPNEKKAGKKAGKNEEHKEKEKEPKKDETRKKEPKEKEESGTSNEDPVKKFSQFLLDKVKQLLKERIDKDKEEKGRRKSTVTDDEIPSVAIEHVQCVKSYGPKQHHYVFEVIIRNE